MNLLLLACLSPLIAADEPETWYGELRLTQLTADTEAKCDTFGKCDLQFEIPGRGCIQLPLMQPFCSIDSIYTDIAKNTNKNSWAVDEPYGSWNVIEPVEIRVMLYDVDSIIIGQSFDHLVEHTFVIPRTKQTDTIQFTEDKTTISFSYTWETKFVCRPGSGASFDWFELSPNCVCPKQTADCIGSGCQVSNTFDHFWVAQTCGPDGCKCVASTTTTVSTTTISTTTTTTTTYTTATYTTATYTTTTYITGTCHGVIERYDCGSLDGIPESQCEDPNPLLKKDAERYCPLMCNKCTSTTTTSITSTTTTSSSTTSTTKTSTTVTTRTFDADASTAASTPPALYPSIGTISLLLLLFAVVYTVKRSIRRQQRAKAALEEAKDTLNIPRDCGCELCSGSSDHGAPPTANPSVPYTVAGGQQGSGSVVVTTTNQEQLQIQFCIPMEQDAPAVLATSQLVANPSFVGIVLDSGTVSSSTTDEIAPTLTFAPPTTTSKLDKFVAPVMVLGDNTLAAIGLTSIMGVDPKTYRDLKDEHAIKKIISEFKNNGEHWPGDEQSDQQIVAGLVNGSYCNPGTTTPLPSLAELMQTIEMVRLKRYGLKSHHVLAIRTYTTSCYRSINSPMRRNPHAQLPHPFAATMYYITTGLKILRAAQGEDTVNASKEQCFYRGLRDLQISTKFMEMGGTEMSCMSTTLDINVAAAFASGSMSPLIFRYLSNDFMSSGACIWFISVYPEEKEVLYPPLTYLSCPTAGSHTEVVINGQTFPLVEVRPTYPET